MKSKILTSYRKQNNDEVEHIHPVLKVLELHGDEANDGLDGEDSGEDKVEVVEGKSELLGLPVVLNHHCCHVQNDDRHDEEFEVLG